MHMSRSLKSWQVIEARLVSDKLVSFVLERGRFLYQYGRFNNCAQATDSFSTKQGPDRDKKDLRQSFNGPYQKRIVVVVKGIFNKAQAVSPVFAFHQTSHSLVLCGAPAVELSAVS